MANIRSYRKKIKSAKNIAKITRAMQMVAASKMKRAQDLALSGKDYALGLEDLSKVLSASKLSHYLLNSQITNHPSCLLILVAPEKGLCGSLVSNLYKKVLFFLDENKNKNIEFVCVGKKAKDIANKLSIYIAADFSFGFSYPGYDFVTGIAKFVKDKFAQGAYQEVNIIYSDFINTMVQIPNERKLLPIKRNIDDQINNNFFLFEPDMESVISPFLNMFIELELYQTILEAYASEQSARMVSMKAATDNANGLINQLTIDYNKARQASITAEILDIGNATDILTNQ